VQDLVAEIQATSIQEELDENVANMAAKIYRICKHITGMVILADIPKDLHEVCAEKILEYKDNSIQC